MTKQQTIRTILDAAAAKRRQPIEIDKGIRQIISPDGRVCIKIVPPDEFQRLEADEREDDYCTIVGPFVLISSKAKYDHVLIDYLG